MQKQIMLALSIVLATELIAIPVSTAFASNEGAGDEIECSPPVNNPYDEDTNIIRCSDNNIIVDKETGEEKGNVKETPQGAMPCSQVDKEQFPGTTLGEVCINPSSPN
jgi:hypothetical protein